MAGVTNTTPSHLLERAAPPLAAHPPARPPVASVRGAFREQLLAVKGVETAPLRGRDAATVELRGMDVVREHAAELLAKRLAPAVPHKDGKQTPYRGHPVFVAQHATATCCRGCSNAA